MFSPGLSYPIVLTRGPWSEKLTSQPKLCVIPIPLHSASDNIRKSPVSLSWKYLERSTNEVGYERLSQMKENMDLLLW
jgi:hypothetical protein